MEIKTYTGGIIETNSYLIKGDDGYLVIDAAEGVVDFLKKNSLKPAGLVLTHGHWDHIWDGARLAKEFSCPVYYHKGDETLCLDPGKMTSFGLPTQLEPVKATRLLEEGDSIDHAPYSLRVLHVPGHSPGSICLYEPKAKVLFGGDVLFDGGVGRWDLPGGSNEMLVTNIRQKLLSLPDDTVVYPGHGPFTTIGAEKKHNPFL